MREENKVTCVCVNTNVQEALSASIYISFYRRAHASISVWANTRGRRKYVCAHVSLSAS